LVGSAIEWFRLLLYGTVAGLVFNRLFFPNYDPVVGLLLTYLSFSLTFLVRPFGGFFFSHIGDKIGRKKTLVLTLSLMGVSTFLIGLLPGYDVLGVWAPILLVLLAIVQGWASPVSGAVHFFSPTNTLRPRRRALRLRSANGRATRPRDGDARDDARGDAA